MGTVPTVCRMVEYTLTEQNATVINRRRVGTAAPQLRHQASDGTQLHVGNTVRAGEVYPLVITRVWGATDTSAVNGQVLLDGSDVLWVTSVTAGDGPGHFTWPARP